MTERWEYLTVRWRTTTREGPSGQSEWRAEYHIFRSGQDNETRTEYDFGKEEKPKMLIVDLLNELGAEGWELATETVLASAAGWDFNGYSEVGAAVDMRWILKRRVLVSSA